MKKFSSTYIYLITSLVLSIALCVLYVSLFLSLSQIKDERITLVSELSNDKNSNIVKENEKVREYFVVSGEEAVFVSSIEQACSSFGVVCETLSLEESKPNTEIASLQILKIKIKTAGEFDSIMSFLKNIEQSKYPIAISEASLNENSTWEGVFTISVPVVPR